MSESTGLVDGRFYKDLKVVELKQQLSESTGLVNGRFYKDLKVVELKEELRSRWLPTGGLKGVLQARLLRALRKEADIVRYNNTVTQQQQQLQADLAGEVTNRQ